MGGESMSGKRQRIKAKLVRIRAKLSDLDAWLHRRKAMATRLSLLALLATNYAANAESLQLVGQLFLLACSGIFYIGFAEIIEAHFP